jgi:hypothetical protein
MPIFKRRDPSHDDSTPGDATPSRILAEREILDRIEEEIFRAARYGRPLVVLCARAQLLTNETLSAREAAAAAEVVGAQLRFSDRVGTLADGSVVAVLPETTMAVARAIAHRIAADLTTRSTATFARKWSVGASTYPDDGEDPPAIVMAAMTRASA